MVHAVNPRITAEEDAILTASRTPDDPRMGSLWGMERIQAPEAWDIATAATNVNVAVVDTGVNYFHEDLTDNIVRDTENLFYIRFFPVKCIRTDINFICPKTKYGSLKKYLLNI